MQPTPTSSNFRTTLVWSPPGVSTVISTSSAPRRRALATGPPSSTHPPLLCRLSTYDRTSRARPLAPFFGAGPPGGALGLGPDNGFIPASSEPSKRQSIAPAGKALRAKTPKPASASMDLVTLSHGRLNSASLRTPGRSFTGKGQKLRYTFRACAGSFGGGSSGPGSGGSSLAGLSSSPSKPGPRSSPVARLFWPPSSASSGSTSSFRLVGRASL
mmetsp:Transcript_1746/g.3141  ORF Transcript_1746/g.3141 Transcript_1746/m.3141 type:complete len:215 (-) Transcript_1746:229-873(-)